MVVDFTDLCDNVIKGIQELIKYHSCVAWLDYGDDGNPCYDPYVFDTRVEREIDALTHAAVKVELAKNSSTHHLLAELVAKDVKNEYITYDWLIKIVARILCGTSVIIIIAVPVHRRCNRKLILVHQTYTPLSFYEDPLFYPLRRHHLHDMPSQSFHLHTS